MSTIELTNIGPIEHLSIPLRTGGGVTVLKGRNGKGKTIALEAIDALVGGNGKPSSRDGVAKGEVEGLGARITVGKTVRRHGGDELEVHALDSRLDLSQIIDPGIDDPERADARSIKGLIQFSARRLDMQEFYTLLGSREVFGSLVPLETTENEDWLTMAAKVKRGLESKARDEEKAAAQARAQAEALKQAGEGLDLTAETDEAALHAALEQAVRAETTLKDQAKSIATRIAEAAVAKMHLDKAKEMGVASTAEVDVELEGLRAKRHGTVEAIGVIEASLASAKAKLAALAQNITEAEKRRSLLEQHNKSLSRWESSIQAASGLTPIPDAAIEEATGVTAEARKAIEVAAVVRRAKTQLELREEARKAAKKHERDAEWLRERAKATDEVLSAVVAGSCQSIRVEAGRLVTDTDRGATHFRDLSIGQRTRLTVEAATRAVGTNGLFTLRQEYWEGLDPVNREEANAIAMELGANIITAEADAAEAIHVEAA